MANLEGRLCDYIDEHGESCSCEHCKDDDQGADFEHHFRGLIYNLQAAGVIRSSLPRFKSDELDAEILRVKRETGRDLNERTVWDDDA